MRNHEKGWEKLTEVNRSWMKLNEVDRKWIETSSSVNSGRLWSDLSLRLGLGLKLDLDLAEPGAYILKAGVQTSQTIWNFLQKDCLRTQKLSIPISNSSSHNKHTSWFILTSYFRIMHFSDFWLIYALMSQNVVVAIYALFPQFFWDWKKESAGLFTFRMYGQELSVFRIVYL